MNITPLPPYENQLYLAYAKHHYRTVDEQRLADTEDGVTRYIKFLEWLKDWRIRFVGHCAATFQSHVAFDENVMFSEATFRKFLISRTPT